MYRSIEARYDAKIVTMYGMTEAFPLAFKSVSCDGVPGTSGQVNPAFEVRIVGADGRQLPTGAVGEIACRPKSANAMSMGYVDATGDGSALVVTPHDEWFRTGDLGCFDDDGNLTYVDRAKDSLRRRGENVSSVEVETTVMRHPAVLEAAAVAVPSDLGEDDILVVVTLAPGAVFDHAELLDFCSARMPYFCVPRYLEVLDEIPKNVIGRVRKDVLRERVSAKTHGTARITATYSVVRTGETDMTMTYQQEFVLAGVAGRAAILNLNARYNRLYSAGDLAAG